MTRSVTALLISLLLCAGTRLQAQHHPMEDETDAASAAAAPRGRGRPAPNAPAPAPVNRDIQVRSWASQTAAWVGDPIAFNVEITCAPNVDVLADDLAQDKLKITGLEFLGSGELAPVAAAGGATTRRFRYDLTTYEVGTTNLEIGETKIRYFTRRPGQRLEDASAAGEVVIPGAVLALRSTIPDLVNRVETRDQQRAEMLPAVIAFARPVGLGLIVVSIVPVGLLLVSLVRTRRPRSPRRSLRAARTHARTAIEELRALDTSTAAARVEAYGRLEEVVRRHVAEATGIPAPALTAAEIEARLSASHPAISAESIRELLGECEQARYGTPGRLPGSERFEAALATTEQVLGRGKR